MQAEKPTPLKKKKWRGGEPIKKIKRNVTNLDFSRDTVCRLKKKGEPFTTLNISSALRKKKKSWLKQRDYVNKKKEIAMKPEHAKKGYVPEGGKSGYFATT